MKHETKRLFWICLAVLGVVLAVLTIVPAVANIRLRQRVARIHEGMSEAEAVGILQTMAADETGHEVFRILRRTPGTNEIERIRVIRSYEDEVPCFNFRQLGLGGGRAGWHAVRIESGRVTRIEYEDPRMNVL